ncbi:acyltransferase family protein [Streptacidiphilus sp. 4-A2]|nr:acyltransferase family protein [Streptacidiphilus sp. 4-A2]
MSAQPLPTARRSRLESLTGLRWFAALAVFTYHTWQVASVPKLKVVAIFGDAGVAFFFVLSGFVLTWSFSEKTGKGTFYWRRFARIWPALAASTVFAYFALRQVWSVSGKDVLLGLTFTQAWHPNVLLTGNPVSWSLSAEAFFYLLFPLVIRPILRCRARVLLVLAALLVGLDLGFRWWSFNYYLPHHNDTFHLLLVLRVPPYRALEFLLGVVVGAAMVRGWRPRVPMSVALLVTAVDLWACWYGMRQHWLGDYWWNQMLAPAFALIIVAAVGNDLAGRRSVFRTRPLVALGEWSYAFYLIHLTVIHALLPYVKPTRARTGRTWSRSPAIWWSRYCWPGSATALSSARRRGGCADCSPTAVAGAPRRSPSRRSPGRYRPPPGPRRHRCPSRPTAERTRTERPAPEACTGGPVHSCGYAFGEPGSAPDAVRSPRRQATTPYRHHACHHACHHALMSSQIKVAATMSTTSTTKTESTAPSAWWRSRGTLDRVLSGRANSFGFLRLMLALSVVYPRYPLSTVTGEDPLWRFSGEQTDIGKLAVIGFFVLSGFMITASGRRLTTGRYAWHRALRIFPGLWVTVLVTALVVAPLLYLHLHGTTAGSGTTAGPVPVHPRHRHHRHRRRLRHLPGDEHRGQARQDLQRRLQRRAVVPEVRAVLLHPGGHLRGRRTAAAGPRTVPLLALLLWSSMVMNLVNAHGWRGFPTEGSTYLNVPVLEGMDTHYLVYLGFAFLLGASFQLFREHFHINDVAGVLSAVVLVASFHWGAFRWSATRPSPTC